MTKSTNSSIFICSTCVIDSRLEKIVRSQGEVETCSGCNKKKKSITIEKLAKIIDPIFRKYFRHGEPGMNWFAASEGRDPYQQDGESLRHTLQWMIGEFRFEDILISELRKTEQQSPGDVYEPFYGDDCNYEEKTDGRYRLQYRWEQIENKIKFRQRYFDTEIKDFFKEIFQDLNKLSGFDSKEKVTSPVLQIMPIGKKIWRGRKCSSNVELKQYLAEPENTLGPPPSTIARAGRMNSEGVSVFYGSRESTTCAAEMRPPIGEKVLTAEFETNRPLRLLNFIVLDMVESDRASYFDRKFVEKEDRRRFINGLHRLISKPVVPGCERDYLITQALSEYLSHVHYPKIDGLIFNSVQEEGGENYVLFLRPQDENLQNNSTEFDLPINRTSRKPELIETLKVQYNFNPVEYTLKSDGNIHFDIDYSDSEW